MYIHTLRERCSHTNSLPINIYRHTHMCMQIAVVSHTYTPPLSPYAYTHTHACIHMYSIYMCIFGESCSQTHTILSLRTYFLGGERVHCSDTHIFPLLYIDISIYAYILINICIHMQKAVHTHTHNSLTAFKRCIYTYIMKGRPIVCLSLIHTHTSPS